MSQKLDTLTLRLRAMDFSMASSTAIGPSGGQMRHAFPDELARTNPDLIVHDPTAGVPREWDDPGFFWLNEQLLVVRTGETGLLATWTSERLDPHVLRVACSRSEDGGQTWLGAEYIDGDGIGDGGPAAWQVPVIGPTGRIYLLYSYSPQPGAGPFCGGLRSRTSDDGGATWSPPADLRFPRSSIDSSDTDRPSIWISIAVPPVTDSGGALLGFTRWADNPGVAYGGSGIKERYSHIEFLRFENLGETPEAEDVQLTPLNVAKPITVPHEDCQSASFAQEPYTVVLPDGHILWYPDRKGFLVGKHLRDEWLGTLEKPRKAEGSCPR